MYIIKDNIIKISVRNLVEFIFCEGDIDNRNGGMSDVKVMQEGTRLHKKIQKSMGSLYKAEVPLKMDFPIQSVRSNQETDNYIISIEGRADGIIGNMEEDEDGIRMPITDITIDEIKTMQADVMKLKEPIYIHKAQAMCYGYIFAQQHELDMINIQLTYCNIENEMITRFNEQYRFEELHAWFYKLLDEFQKWTDFIFISKRSRQQTIKTIEFPFEYRDGQKNLVTSVYRTIQQNRNLYIQAPTGVGKTISTVFPAIKAIGEDLANKIFYLTAKTVTRAVAEETFNMLTDNGLCFRTVTITAKDKVCVLDERNCNPQSCERAKGHYDRVNAAVYDLVTHEYFIDREKIEQYAYKHKVCPFEMSLDVTYWCDGIICDYNYVFDPNVRLKRYFAEGNKGDYIFLIDEAHNLVDRAREMYSAKLIKEEFLEVKKTIKDTDKKMAAALEKCNKSMLELKRECDNYEIIESSSHFVMLLERLFYIMQTFFEEHRDFKDIDVVSDLYLKIRHFLNMYEIMDEKYITYTQHMQDRSFSLNLYCVDPSGNISTCIGQCISAVLFSATLLPIMYFKEMLTGNCDDYAVYAQSPFDTDKRKIVIASDVSSKYTRRNVNEYKKICVYIQKITSGEKGNYMVFFPSYTYMENVYEQMSQMGFDDLKIVRQTHSMNENEREDFLRQFKEQSGIVAFCVIGGVFSEGIDLKNDSLIGAIIVGTGLPMICNERQILKQYFDDMGRNGYQYAYVYPGMNKVLQAAGRVIRTSEDIGIVALLDERFLTREYESIFPREWNEYYQVKQNTIEDSISAFWKRIKK